MEEFECSSIQNAKKNIVVRVLPMLIIILTIRIGIIIQIK